MLCNRVFWGNPSKRLHSNKQRQVLKKQYIFWAYTYDYLHSPYWLFLWVGMRGCLAHYGGNAKMQKHCMCGTNYIAIFLSLILVASQFCLDILVLSVWGFQSISNPGVLHSVFVASVISPLWNRCHLRKISLSMLFSTVYQPLYFEGGGGLSLYTSDAADER